MTSEILIASNNKGKLVEIADLLKAVGIKAVSPEPFNIPEPEETGKTFEENAILKAKYYSEKTGLVSLADDSGLCIDALDGRPGIASARFAQDENGNKNFPLAFEKIQKELVSIGLDANQDVIKAHFICNLALFDPTTKQVKSFEGRVDGRIVFPARGDKGFGYDPIFIADGMNQTFGEILSTQKDKISHRTKAFEKLILLQSFLQI